MEVEALLAVPKSLDLLQWTLVRDQIEVLDGLECWDKVAPFATLQQAAISGLVIIVNISQFRSDAIIVQCHDEPRVVPLPDAEPRDIDKLISRFSGALSITEERTKTKTIQAILRLLWTGIVKPIVAELRAIGVPHGSRIWWLPTYRLSLLPLHAAGPYKSNMPNLPDIYISSYIPMFETLLRSRHNPLDQFNSRLLVVAHPDPYAHQTLQHVYEEIRLVREVTPVGSNLIGQGTSRDALLTSLQTHRWVHMAAHGSQNLFDPFASSFFRLRDGLLTLLDISSTTLPPVQLAYLSACHSAFTGETPDEAIHLAAAVHFAGFRSVIGSLYAVADVDGPIVAKEVYEHLRRLAEQEGGTMDYTNAAEALNVATRVLRDMRVPVDRWINYVHIGA
ncbi:hypothetical protein FRC03_010242 [Tulasnella sp. 419]|nr:hypothetical protein FRC03_010242 [Tulasnella sp. 419]